MNFRSERNLNSQKKPRSKRSGLLRYQTKVTNQITSQWPYGATVIVTGVLLLSEPEVPISSMVVVPLGARLEALQSMVTVALPLAGTLTGFEEAVAETSVGNSFTLKSTEPLNPFTLVIVSVVPTVLPSSMVNEDGDNDIVKFLVPVEVTVREMVVLLVVEPDVPVIVTVAVPTVAEEDAVSVRVEVALPLAGGVTGLVEKAAVTPLGNPLALSVVAESNPPVLVTVIVLVPLLP